MEMLASDTMAGFYLFSSLFYVLASKKIESTEIKIFK